MPTRRLRHGRAPVIAALMLALCPAAASAAAAYAPKLAVEVAPATPNSPSRLVTTITQLASEPASKKAIVSIPKGFSASAANITGLPACTTAQIDARACPESTRIGSADATASILGLLTVGLSGTVNWGGPTGDGRFLVLVFLDNATLNQHFVLRGYVSLNSDGGFDTTFDGLPAQTTTNFTLTFDGGAKAIILTPATCGTFVFTAKFTAQTGDYWQAATPVSIAGCPPAPAALSRVRATTRYVSFRLGAPAAVRVLVKGPGKRVQLDRRVSAAAGTTKVRLKHRLRKGTYRISVTATAAGATPVTKKARLTVRR